MRRLTAFFTFLFLTLRLFSQFEITGVVIDSETNQPLPGVNIILVGTNIGTLTDINGKFSLSYDYTIKKIDSIMRVEITYIGYLSKIIKASNRDTLEVYLSPDLSIFKDYKIKNSVNLGYYGDILNAPYGLDVKYFLQGIGEVFLNFDFNFRYWTDIKNNNARMFSFNYDIPNSSDFIPDNFHLSSTKLDYQKSNFKMTQTKAKLTNVWRLFAIDYGVTYTKIDSLSNNYYSFNFGTYIDLENIYWLLNSIEAFVHIDYGNRDLFYDFGLTKGFYFQKFTSFSLTIKYFDYNYINGLNFSFTFNIFSTNRMLCCYSWQPRYE